MKQLSDDELIAAGERALARLQSLDATIRADLWRVALIFGIPFLAYLAPSIYQSFRAEHRVESSSAPSRDR
jgi:hypothetical protein